MNELANNTQGQKKSTQTVERYCGFIIEKDKFVIPVLDIQEVVRPHSLTHVPMSPDYLMGLMNLRGQIVTSISLRKLFSLEDQVGRDHMNIIVKMKEGLYALRVDEIMDVVELSTDSFERTPETLDLSFKKYTSGVFKVDSGLLVKLNMNKILD